MVKIKQETKEYKKFRVQPKRFSDVKEFADKLKQNISVIMDLKFADDKLAKRLIDFAAGLVFAIDGEIEKADDKIYILLPFSTATSAKDKHSVPEFKSAEEEAKFWENHSPLDYPDYFKETKMEVTKPLKQKRIISIRLDDETIEVLTKLARRKRIGVSTLARTLIAEELERTEKTS